jgi:hypothetical protein
MNSAAFQQGGKGQRAVHVTAVSLSGRDALVALSAYDWQALTHKDQKQCVLLRLSLSSS